MMMASEQEHDTVERGAIMAEFHLQKVVCKAVCVALLISGDLEAAENVVADAIQSLDAEDLNTDALFLCVSALSIQCARNAADLSVRSKQGEPSFALPPELQNVLYLPRLPRCCFVLRFLLRLPVSTSACLLQLEPDQVIDYSSAAVCMLGAITTREVSNDQLSCLPALSA
jgi:hypothetical protein